MSPGAAVRRLRREPAAALGMAATLALGIAAVTSTFTVVDAVVLRPLPFPGSERAVALCETAPRLAGFCVASPANVEDWERASRTIERFGVARDWSFRLGRAGEAPVSLSGGVATPGYFDAIGARAAVGRLIEPADLRRDGSVAVVLSAATWQRLFGGDPSAVGRAVTFDGRAATIVGVLTADAYTPRVDAEAWAPLTAISDDVTNRAWRGFVALGRLAPGRTVEEAVREMEVVRAGLAASYPDANRGYGLEVHRLRDRTAAPVRGTLVAFLAAVSCVLLIGCANAAGLMLVRATKRRRETALRAALGASRSRLVREVLAEGLVVAAAGAALGLLLSSLALRAFVLLAPPGLPRAHEVKLDALALAFGSGLSLATVLAFALVPALRASRVDLAAVLQGGRATDGEGGRLRRGLVVAQVTLAMALLASAGALGRSVAAALGWNPGFDFRRVAAVSLFAPGDAGWSGARAVEAFERAAEAAASVPGVASASLASAGPLFGGTETATVSAFGRSAEDGAAARWFDVGPGYFATLGLKVAAGRDFEPADGPQSSPVAIVNEALARRLWPGTDPLGRELAVEGARRVVVGVVRDVPPVSPGAATMPEVYWPKRQYPRYGTYLVVRAAGDPAGLERALRRRLAETEPALEVGGFRPLERALERATVSPRFALALASAFAGVALALAAVGLYGVLAFAVASRTREIGVRLALGASPGQVAWATVRDGLRLVLAGVALGVPASVAAFRGLTLLVPDLSTAGPAVVALAAAVFAIVAILAAGLPARRASRLDPAVALRLE